MKFQFLLVLSTALIQNLAEAGTKTILTKNSDQFGTVQDTVTITKAAKSMLGANVVTIRVKEAPGIIVCDPEDGSDCQGREITLSNGQQKILMILKRDQSPLLRAGDTILIDREQLTYIDRSIEHFCNQGNPEQEFTVGGILDSGGFYVFPCHNFTSKLNGWGLRSSTTGEILKHLVLKAPETYEILSGRYDEHIQGTMPARLPILLTEYYAPYGIGFICSTQNVLNLGVSTQKTISIPLIKGN